MGPTDGRLLGLKQEDTSVECDISREKELSSKRSSLVGVLISTKFRSQVTVWTLATSFLDPGPLRTSISFSLIWNNSYSSWDILRLNNHAKCLIFNVFNSPRSYLPFLSSIFIARVAPSTPNYFPGRRLVTRNWTPLIPLPGSMSTWEKLEAFSNPKEAKTR